MFFKDKLLKGAIKTETQFLDVYSLCRDGTNYKIAFTKKRANRKTQILCSDNKVTRLFRMSRFANSEDIILQPSSFIEENTACILVVTGSPAMIGGLDEGIFSSNIPNPDGKLYVMSIKKLKNTMCN